MRSAPEIISLLTNPGVIAVVRARSSEQVLPLSEALVAGGLLAIEITLTTPNALEAIRALRERLGESALIGAGSVIDAAACRDVIAAGAEFVVSPIVKAEIAQTARAANRPVMLGAYTPTEAQAAHEAGADFVKLFPADTLGPAYIKSIRAPLPHLRIVPTGGVDLQTLPAFFKAGCAAVGVGSSLLSPAILEGADWAELTRLARAYVAAARGGEDRR